MHCLKNILVLAAFIFVGPVAAADILEIQTRRVTIKSVTPDSVTVEDSDSVFTIFADLLNTMTAEVGDRLALDMVVGPRFSVWEGQIRKVWKMYPGEEWVTGVIITQKDTSGVVEITMDELDSREQRTFRFSTNPLDVKPGDTLTVVEKFDYLVRRPTQESSLETRTDTSRQRYQIADHRPRLE